MKAILLRAASVAVLVSGGATAPAVAANEPAAAALEEIVVAARRREESLQDVPLAVSALTGEQVEQRGIRNIETLGTSVPGLVVAPGPGGKAVPQISIRGQRVQEQTMLADASVGFYFGDILYERTDGAGGSFYDLASVEVLKGPQGTLFGRNTTGGAVLVRPNRPTNSFDADVVLGFGARSGNTQEVMLNVPITPTLAVRFAGKREKQDGYIRDLLRPGTELNEVNMTGGRASILFAPTEGFENLTIFSTFRDKGSPLGWRDVRPGVVSDAQYNRIYETRSGKVQRNDLKTWDVANTSTLNLGSATAKLILGYRDISRNDLIDLDAQPTSGALYINYNTDVQQFTAEAQLLGKSFADRLDWIVGLYHYKEQGSNINKFSVIQDFDGQGISFGKNTSNSIFAQGSYKLTDALSLTAGARMTEDKRRASIRNQWTSGSIIAGVFGGVTCRIFDHGVALNPCATDNQKNWSEPTWLVSLDYKLNTDTLVYLAHRHGYRSGTLQIRGDTVEQLSKPANPEFVNDIELGLKTQWAAGVPGRLNVAAYYSDYKDAQRLQNGIASDGITPTSLLLNAGSAKVQGIEADFAFALTPHLELSGFADYTDAKYKKFGLFNVNTGRTDDVSNWMMGSTPKFKLGASARYIWPLGPSTGDIVLFANYFHTDEYLSDDVNIALANAQRVILDYSVIDQGAMDRFLIKGYGLADFRVDWKSIMGSHLDAGVFLKNAFDKEYDVAAAQVGGRGLMVRAAGEPRTWGAEVRYTF
jgi:iron complex outermembrane receptor protein